MKKKESNKKHDYESQNNYLIYGRNAVLEFLKSEKNPEKIYLLKQNYDILKNDTISNIYNLIQTNNINFRFLEKEELDDLSDNGAHQGVVAVIPAIQFVDIKDIIKNAKAKNKLPFIIIADQIEDPHNLGALIRTADAVGADAVVVPKNRSAPINATVFKTSAGALAHLPIAQVTNIVDTLKYLKSENIWVFGADMDGEVFYKANLSGSIALVMGAEGKGIRPLVKENCDGIVSLPMNGKIQSLNVSVAGGILMYEILRQRDINN